MKEISISLFMIYLFGLVGNAIATSPMPEEVKPGMAATVCTIHITCTKDRETGTQQELTSTFAFEASEARNDVLDWVTRYVHDRMNERNLSEFKVDCRFAK